MFFVPHYFAMLGQWKAYNAFCCKNATSKLIVKPEKHGYSLCGLCTLSLLSLAVALPLRCGFVSPQIMNYLLMLFEHVVENSTHTHDHPPTHTQKTGKKQQQWVWKAGTTMASVAAAQPGRTACAGMNCVLLRLDWYYRRVFIIIIIILGRVGTPPSYL